MTKSSYESLGASASKQGLHDALSKAGISEQEGLFAGVNSDLAGDPDYRSFLHCDGAGTKTIVAHLLYQATKDASVFAGLAQDALVMNLDDVFCLGVPEKLILANAIARNTTFINDDILAALIKSYKDLVQKFTSLGIDIELSGGETADCGDTVRTLVADAVLAGRIHKDKIINANAIVPGDVIIGLSGTGQASYEAKPNSSVGSNGLTLARHALLNNSYITTNPEVVEPSLSSSVAYQGPFLVTDEPSELGCSVGEALLSPTRSYAPILLKISNAISKNLHAAIHCTGGGQTKVLRFGKGNRYVKNNLFKTPPLFALIQKEGKVDWREMYQVFNMGHRMEVYVPKEVANTVIEISNSFSVDAQVVGTVEKSSGKNEVVIDSENGPFSYSL